MASEVLTRVQRRVNRDIRGAIGLSKDPPPRCTDPDEAYFALDSVARVIHGDLPPMLVGGLGSLFIQMLHPHTMAGVAEHSRYREDPLGRLLQTANFIGFTTYGTKAQAYASIERVLAVHQVVRGVADDGIPYYANDPHLLAWVHAAETSMFLSAYRRYGTVPLSDADADRYVNEMATLALDLGMIDPPRSVAALAATIQRFRPELRLSADGAVARDFVIRGVQCGLLRRSVNWLLVRASFALMSRWQVELLGVPYRPLRNRYLIQPMTAVLCRLIRLFVPPPPR
ncbi:MAG: oxygenase MpaB family protein [Acidimicrobiales bacterium]